MIKRREFLKKAAALFTLISSGCIEERDKAGIIEEINISDREVKPLTIKSKVYVIKTNSRESGIKELLKYFDGGNLSGKRVALKAVSYTHLRAHETRHDLVCRLLLEKKKNN